MQRIRLKGKRRLLGKNYFLIIVLAIILTLYCVFRIINLKVNPVLIDFAELESRKLASIVVNNAVSKNITQSINLSNRIGGIIGTFGNDIAVALANALIG